MAAKATASPKPSRRGRKPFPWKELWRSSLRTLSALVPLWLNPKGRGPVLDQRQVLAAQCRTAAKALFLIYAATSLAGLFPIRIGQSLWHLGFTAAFVNNGVILLFCLLCGSLSLYWDPVAKKSRRLGLSLRFYSRVSSIFFALLILAQVVTASVVAGQTLSGRKLQSVQLQAEFEQARAKVMSADAGTLSVLEQRVRGAAAPRPLDAQSLPAVRQAIMDVFGSNLQAAKNKLSQQARQELLTLAVDSMRVILVAMALSVACSAFAQRNIGLDAATGSKS